MRGAILYGPRDVRLEERAVPTIIEPTDAIIRISATCVCGSDLWPYRGISPVPRADPDGARVLRHCRGGRQRGHFDKTQPVRHRVLLRLRQHRPGGSVGYLASGTESSSTARAVLHPRQSPWWPCAGAPLPARADQSGVEQEDQPRQGLRSDPAPRSGAEGYRAMDERRAIKTLLRP